MGKKRGKKVPLTPVAAATGAQSAPVPDDSLTADEVQPTEKAELEMPVPSATGTAASSIKETSGLPTEAGGIKAGKKEVSVKKDTTSDKPKSEMAPCQLPMEENKQQEGKSSILELEPKEHTESQKQQQKQNEKKPLGKRGKKKGEPKTEPETGEHIKSEMAPVSKDTENGDANLAPTYKGGKQEKQKRGGKKRDKKKGEMMCESEEQNLLQDVLTTELMTTALSMPKETPEPKEIQIGTEVTQIQEGTPGGAGQLVESQEIKEGADQDLVSITAEKPSPEDFNKEDEAAWCQVARKSGKKKDKKKADRKDEPEPSQIRGTPQEAAARTDERPSSPDAIKAQQLSQERAKKGRNKKKGDMKIAAEPSEKEDDDLTMAAAESKSKDSLIDFASIAPDTVGLEEEPEPPPILNVVSETKILPITPSETIQVPDIIDALIEVYGNETKPSTCDSTISKQTAENQQASETFPALSMQSCLTPEQELSASAELGARQLAESLLAATEPLTELAVLSSKEAAACLSTEASSHEVTPSLSKESPKPQSKEATQSLFQEFPVPSDTASVSVEDAVLSKEVMEPLVKEMFELESLSKESAAIVSSQITTLSKEVTESVSKEMTEHISAEALELLPQEAIKALSSEPAVFVPPDILSQEATDVPPKEPAVFAPTEPHALDKPILPECKEPLILPTTTGEVTPTPTTEPIIPASVQPITTTELIAPEPSLSTPTVLGVSQITEPTISAAPEPNIPQFIHPLAPRATAPVPSSGELLHFASPGSIISMSPRPIVPPFTESALSASAPPFVPLQMGPATLSPTAWPPKEHISSSVGLTAPLSDETITEAPTDAVVAQPADNLLMFEAAAVTVQPASNLTDVSIKTRELSEPKETDVTDGEGTSAILAFEELELEDDFEIPDLIEDDTELQFPPTALMQAEEMFRFEEAKHQFETAQELLKGLEILPPKTGVPTEGKIEVQPMTAVSPVAEADLKLSQNTQPQVQSQISKAKFVPIEPACPFQDEDEVIIDTGIPTEDILANLSGSEINKEYQETKIEKLAEASTPLIDSPFMTTIDQNKVDSVENVKKAESSAVSEPPESLAGSSKKTTLIEETVNVPLEVEEPLFDFSKKKKKKDNKKGKKSDYKIMKEEEEAQNIFFETAGQQQNAKIGPTQVTEILSQEKEIMGYAVPADTRKEEDKSKIEPEAEATDFTHVGPDEEVLPADEKESSEKKDSKKNRKKEKKINEKKDEPEEVGEVIAGSEQSPHTLLEVQAPSHEGKECKVAIEEKASVESMTEASKISPAEVGDKKDETFQPAETEPAEFQKNKKGKEKSSGKQRKRKPEDVEVKKEVQAEQYISADLQGAVDSIPIPTDMASESTESFPQEKPTLTYVADTKLEDNAMDNEQKWVKKKGKQSKGDKAKQEEELNTEKLTESVNVMPATGGEIAEHVPASEEQKLETSEDKNVTDIKEQEETATGKEKKWGKKKGKQSKDERGKSEVEVRSEAELEKIKCEEPAKDNEAILATSLGDPTENLLSDKVTDIIGTSTESTTIFPNQQKRVVDKEEGKGKNKGKQGGKGGRGKPEAGLKQAVTKDDATAKEVSKDDKTTSPKPTVAETTDSSAEIALEQKTASASATVSQEAETPTEKLEQEEKQSQKKGKGGRKKKGRTDQMEDNTAASASEIKSETVSEASDTKPLAGSDANKSSAEKDTLGTKKNFKQIKQDEGKSLTNKEPENEAESNEKGKQGGKRGKKGKCESAEVPQEVPETASEPPEYTTAAISETAKVDICELFEEVLETKVRSKLQSTVDSSKTACKTGKGVSNTEKQVTTKKVNEAETVSLKPRSNETQENNNLQGINTDNEAQTDMANKTEEPDTMSPSDITMADEDDTPMNARPVFTPNACHICKALNYNGNQLKSCGACKMIAYCGPEHQKQHWKQHKAVCTWVRKQLANAKIDSLFSADDDTDSEKWKNLRYKYMTTCQESIGRKLELYECEMFLYPRVCVTCHSSNQETLKCCPICHSVNFCSPEHLSKDHSKWCKELQLLLDINIYQNKYGMVDPPLPDKIFETYETMPSTMKEFLVTRVLGPSRAIGLHKIIFSCLTELASYPLTVLYAMQCISTATEEKREDEKDDREETQKEVKKMEDFQGLDKYVSLTIHLVGAEIQFEGDAIAKWDVFILNVLPKLQKLRIILIGPELSSDTIPTGICKEDFRCPHCAATNREFICEFQPNMTYHEYVKSPAYTKPDIIAAFHSGLYRNTGFNGKDSWGPSIPYLIQDVTVPVILTAYTSQESPKDVAQIKKHGQVDTLLPPQRNPYRSLRPNRSFIEEYESPVIYKNNYIAVIRGTN